MSLRLQAFDDAALESLAPKGLVRRARRDLEAGLANVTARDEASAQVLVEGQTVTLGERGPAAARCTCKAGGICRHILVAVMALNHEAAEGTPEAAPPPSAADEICALKEADVIAFAGACWGAAVTLAAESAESSVAESGGNCTVELAGAPGSVTFIAGTGLTGAGFKGPKSRARVVVAAAAILVRAKRGVALETTAGAQADAGSISQAYLDDAVEKLIEAIRAVLSSGSPIAADLLFDLAISARAEAAPRLTAMLRSLAKQARLAGTRDIHFHSDGFLTDAARTFALIEALKHNPQAPELTGSLRRDYRPQPPLGLWMLGAVSWRTEAGARGLTLHGYAAEEHTWYSVSTARAAGMDPYFTPRTAFAGPLWSAGTASGLIGKRLRLPEPLVDAGGAISPTLPQPAAIGAPIPDLRSLIECGAAIQDWQQLRRDLAARMGEGLRRRTLSVPVLLAPAKYSGLNFNDLAQTYEWEAIAADGSRLLFTLPGAEDVLAQRINALTASCHLVLAEMAEDDGRAALRPIAALFDAKDGIEVVNLTLDEWPKSRTASLLKVFFNRKRPQPSADPSWPLQKLAERVIDAAVSIFSGSSAADLGKLGQECDAAGLVALANALDRMQKPGTPKDALAAAYLASETVACLRWA